MHELLQAVAQAVREVGAEATVHVGSFPEADESSAYVVIPHDFFLFAHHRELPTLEQRARTVALTVEHPGTISFEQSAHYAATVGAVMAMNDDSTAELRRRGIDAKRFVLGYSSLWDVWGGDEHTPRPVDITYMGTTDDRRDAILARQAEQLTEWECRLLIPPHEPMKQGRPDFLVGRDKLRHLRSSKVLINLHRGDSRAFEWVRAIEAMSNGTVVVSERSHAVDPLIPGRHLLVGRPENTAALASALLRNPDRLQAMRREAYDLCRDMDMRPSALHLVELAGSLITRTARPKATKRDGPRAASDRVALKVPPHDLPEIADWAAPLPEPLRRLLATLFAASMAGPAEPVLETRSPTQPPAVRVTALIPSGLDREGGTPRTIRSLLAQVMQVGVATGRWNGPVSSHEEEQIRRRGSLLNALLSETSGEHVLVIEPGQELFPQAVRRLVAAMDATPSAVAAFGMMADLTRGELWNSLPLEPQRLKERAYLSAPFLIRRSALPDRGAFSEEPALAGYEYHEFWCRVAERGTSAVLVPQVIGTGCAVRPGEVSIARFAPELTIGALRRAAPRLLDGE